MSHGAACRRSAALASDVADLSPLVIAGALPGHVVLMDGRGGVEIVPDPREPEATACADVAPIGGAS